MRKISILIFLVGFLLFRPYQMQGGMMYPGDDLSYFSHATALVYGQFPSYKKEYFTDGGESPLHSIGAGLMASPFVFLFSWGDRLTGDPIVQQRLVSNVYGSWSLYGFVLSSVVYLWLGCFFLYKGLRNRCQEWESVLAIFLIVLCQGIPLFAFRRPVFSHISEFFVGSLLVWWLLVPAEQRPRWCQGNMGAVVLGAVIGMLVLIRLNAVLMLMVWPLILLAMTADSGQGFRRWQRVFVSYGVAVAGLLVFQILPDLFHKNTGNNSAIQGLLLSFSSPIFYLQRLWHILTGIDWGLIYSAPFLLIGLIGAAFLKFPLRKAVWLSLMPLLVNLYVVMAWKTQGGWYGYRYLLASAIPLAAYPLAVVLRTASERIGKTMVLALCLVVCLLPLMPMLAFEGNSRELTLAVIKQYFGDTGWGNNTYQLNVWKVLIDQPVAFAIAVLQGGPLYVLYCVRVLLDNEYVISQIRQSVYVVFSPALFFKVMLIYATPFILMLIFVRDRVRIDKEPPAPRLVRKPGRKKKRSRR